MFNGSRTIANLVCRIHETFFGQSIEIVLVNDGSSDNSEQVCVELARAHPKTVLFVQLARNFTEHNAVLAGLAHTRGRYVAVLDDDGQNPPEEVHSMLREMKSKGFDVVYGHYIEKQHHWFRNFGSWFNDLMATRMLKKPKHLYLSSFKVMNRFVVDEILKYKGAFPYIDGLIYRTTHNLGQIAVTHCANTSGGSRYTARKLVALWLNMFLNFSIGPLRLSVYTGLFVSSVSVLLLALIWIDKIWITKNITLGIPTVLGTIVFFSGVQLLMLGLIGEYLGRLFLDATGTPQYVVRYTTRDRARSAAAQNS